MADVLLVPGALIFESDWDQVSSQVAIDHLARRLTGARRTWQALPAPWSDGAAHLEWLTRAFGVPGDPPPSAAYSWRQMSGPHDRDSPPSDVWFCEPVHFSLAPERTVLAPIDAPLLTEAESRELLDEAADSARNHGAVLRQAAGRWYLFPDEPWDLRTTPLQAALGASVEARLPQGRQALHWRRLLNEVQMRWHANRVNWERERQGQQVANGLWLHGGGAWRALDASRFARVQSDDAVVLGWRQAAQPDSSDRTRRDSLTVWPELFEPYWRRDWRAWSAAWRRLDSQVEALLRPGGPNASRQLELVACGRRGAVTFMLGRRAGLLPWRRRTLRDCLLEPTLEPTTG
jgi:hypothetical protein